MQRLMKKLMLSCRKASELIEKKGAGGEISKTEKFQLNLHTSVCRLCKDYQKKSEALNNLFRNFYTNQDILTEDMKKAKLSDSDKADIKKKIQNELGLNNG